MRRRILPDRCALKPLEHVVSAGRQRVCDRPSHYISEPRRRVGELRPALEDPTLQIAVSGVDLVGLSRACGAGGNAQRVGEEGEKAGRTLLFGRQSNWRWTALDFVDPCAG